jgi:hypothetical protein
MTKPSLLTLLSASPFRVLTAGNNVSGNVTVFAAGTTVSGNGDGFSQQEQRYPTMVTVLTA